MTKTKGKIIAAVLLMSVTSLVQDAPHLISRPAVVAPDRPEVPPRQPRKCLRRAVVVGSSALAKTADDSCDVIIGPVKAGCVGGAAFETTL